MGYRIIQTERFREDLDEAYRYLTQTLHTRQAARDLRRAIGKARENLGKMPFMVHVSYNPALAKAGLREYPVRGYEIVYLIEGTKVYFVRLLHQSQEKELHIKTGSPMQ